MEGYAPKIPRYPGTRGAQYLVPAPKLTAIPGYPVPGCTKTYRYPGTRVPGARSTWYVPETLGTFPVHCGPTTEVSKIPGTRDCKLYWERTVTA
eukprot:3071344-Rhodomonas_salina.5